MRTLNPDNNNQPATPVIPGTDTDPLDLPKRMLSFDTDDYRAIPAGRSRGNSALGKSDRFGKK